MDKQGDFNDNLSIYAWLYSNRLEDEERVLMN